MHELCYSRTFFHVSGFFQKPPGDAWAAARQRLWLQPSFLGFSVNCLAIKGDLPGDLCGIVNVFVFVWLDNGVRVLIWDSYLYVYN